MRKAFIDYGLADCAAVARFVISQKLVDHVQGCSLDEIGRVGVLR
jgi:predicted ATPase